MTAASKNPSLPFGRRFGEIIQYAYVVADVTQAIAIYVDRFHVGPWFVRGPFTPPGARYLGRPVRMTITLARAFTGNMMIELIQQHDDIPSVYQKVIANGYGFHHWAIAADDVDAEIARFGQHGYPAVFEDTTPSGARVVYVDSTRDLPGMTEILEMNSATQSLYASFYHAAIGWDGSDPIRVG